MNLTETERNPCVDDTQDTIAMQREDLSRRRMTHDRPSATGGWQTRPDRRVWGDFESHVVVALLVGDFQSGRRRIAG